MNTKAPKILIVEDSANILEMLTIMFDFQNWQTASLLSLSNLIETVRDEQPDVILLDMLLSGHNGCSGCAALKQNKELKHIPVIMMSAHPEARNESTAAGADYFIAKPFEIQELIDLVTQAYETGVEREQ